MPPPLEPPPVPDHYEAFYADKLWHLLPAVYRAEDAAASADAAASSAPPGPLRELVERIAEQAAVVRRSMDRLWEDQSIESCDDWLIPYLADLLATNLVASLDARGQRLDVAKTIYYRRRKGTVALLEELAGDVTGWSARVVEFFRVLGRTRHGLDPALGLPAESPDPAGARALQRAQGLTGPLTGTPLGGTADLRSVYGAGKTQTAFDEFFHTADLRRGRGQTGWHNIPRLGVFLWRLRSFPVGPTTPVAVTGCSGHYSFDPTGRDIPLFAAGDRPFGDQWVSPREAQLPTPISGPLLSVQKDDLYAGIDPADGITLLGRSLGVHRRTGVGYDLVPAAQVTTDARNAAAPFRIDPERGRLVAQAPAAGDDFRVTYHYGFAGAIGAGPYDRRVRGTAPEEPAPVRPVAGGGGALATELGALAGGAGTVRIDDFLTYDAVASPVAVAGTVAVRAQNRRRPVVRLPAASEWVFEGAGADSRLLLDGLLVSGGGNVVLRGTFGSVALLCCTLDPGTLLPDGSGFAPAADGRPLAPTRLRIEGQVQRLTLARCVTGPIIAAGGGGGNADETAITDSIVQAHGADLALDLDDGELRLVRSTLLGPADLHRADVSECILHDVVTVDDTQHGCVRFSAWASPGSVLPRQYECVAIAPRAPLFGSRAWGRPDYAQLLASVPAAIAEGAQDGSEMGAFARERNALKERSLRIKFDEFLPLGLVPVIVYAT